MSERTRLEEITIRGLGVIEEASLEFRDGLTVITGETGAGKTMVLTALGLVLGNKADSSLVRNGKERAVVSANFTVTRDVANEVLEKGGNIEDDQLILTRHITTESKSKSSIGGVSVPISVLDAIAENVIEIHGQSSQMNINKPTKQREVLDRFGGIELADAFQIFTHWHETFIEAKKKLASLRSNSTAREKEIADLTFFAESFSKLNPEAGEIESLSQEISRLSSVEALQLGVGTASGALDDESSGVLTTLGQVKRSLESVQKNDVEINRILDVVNEAFYLLSDASHQVHAYLNDLEMDPQRLEWIQLRKSELTKFVKTFSVTTDVDDPLPDLIAKYSKVKESIADLSGGEERIQALEAEVNAAWLKTHESAARLSEVRRKFANELAERVTSEIHDLAMPHTSFHCAVNSPDFSKELKPSQITLAGADEISMLIQTHKDGPFIPLAKGASGGEMSRVMLALEVVLASCQPVGTYIFDEVDAGVGGKAAIDVGHRLHELSKHAQVIVVTHLPQVAAWADSHFVVRKDESGAVTQSDVWQVEGEARVEEIARMLAGHEHSRSAREHATELLTMRTKNGSTS